MQLRFLIYNKLVWELFSSFTIDAAGEYNSGHCYFRFSLVDLTHEMNLAQFRLLHLLASGITGFTHRDCGRCEF